MARPIRGIDIYLPLEFNDGRPVPESIYLALQQELLNRFGGVTSVQRQFPLQGVWRSQPVRHALGAPVDLLRPTLWGGSAVREVRMLTPHRQSQPSVITI